MAALVGGFNLFIRDDHHLFLALARGEWCISGFRALDLRARIPWLTPTRCSSLLKRLRTHGLIKKVWHRYKYHLTKLEGAFRSLLSTSGAGVGAVPAVASLLRG